MCVVLSPGHRGGSDDESQRQPYSQSQAESGLELGSYRYDT